MTLNKEKLSVIFERNLAVLCGKFQSQLGWLKAKIIEEFAHKWGS